MYFLYRDWFEESVEINKNSAQQSPGNVPPDLADLGLVLDVPLDETFFFNGGEHHSTQSQQQYFNQSTQRSTIEQNHDGEGSTSMELGGKQLLDLDLTNQHQVYNSTQTTKNLEFVERKSQYLNCPPTTNLTALQSYLSEKSIQKHPPKSWSNNQPQNLSQQQQQNYHQLNSANVSTMQFMTIPNDGFFSNITKNLLNSIIQILYIKMADVIIFNQTIIQWSMRSNSNQQSICHRIV